jgi:hypothetical protein
MSKRGRARGCSALRDGPQGVGAPHSSVETGERALPGPVERRGRRVVGPTPESRRERSSSVANPGGRAHPERADELEIGLQPGSK